MTEALGQQDQHLLKQQADNADDKNRDDDMLDFQVVPLVPHPEADTAATRQPFSGDNTQPG